MRDKIEAIVQAIQTKEDEVYEGLIDEYEVSSIYKHEDYNSSLFRMASTLEGMASVDNLLALDVAMGKAADKKPLKVCHD